MPPSYIGMRLQCLTSRYGTSTYVRELGDVYAVAACLIRGYMS